MAQFSGQWPAGSLHNMHSSNPQPMTWDEVAELTQVDVVAVLKNAPLGYESSQGNEKLRHSLSLHYHKQIKTNDIVLTSGAQEGIFLTMHALLDPGDHVVVITPCFEPLHKVAHDLGAKVSTCQLKPQDQWRIDWPALTSCLKPETKLLIINFPHNPTGSHISSADLQRIVELCEKNHCWLFSDEVFRGLEHQVKHRLTSAADLYHKAIAIGVVSKALGLPGIRVGWVSTQNQSLVDKIMVIKSHLSICQSSLDAQLCQTLVPHSERLWQRHVEIIKTNKALVEKYLDGHSQLHWHPPQASATGFVQLKNKVAAGFVDDLAKQSSIMVMPNEVFLTQQQGFRLTLGQKGSASLLSTIMKP
ncbi:aspartate/methionine/tyrosine aminotransferase [Marinicella litoralis]|uniref:Aspartate/methionine/tyrosine aminotransferase n=2 Tax=Marinicella litoralis TaxID=644220 RepID=A0A4V3DHS7_9GAMM|nr:aspartate/methionine/tyrosine aminotransferase [Marinicella litoralis]